MDKVDLHVTAIYAMQVFSHNANNPKGEVPKLCAIVHVINYISRPAMEAVPNIRAIVHVINYISRPAIEAVPKLLCNRA